MYKRAVVPLDGSSLAEGILPFLLAIAGPLDVALVLVRVLEPVVPLAVEGMRSVTVDPGDGVRQHDAEDYLRSTAAPLRARGVKVDWQIRSGRPDTEIIAAAQETGADLIAMSTHGRSGVGRLLFGSVAEQVLRHSEVPVFLMRQTGRQAPFGTVEVRR
jgi:nucleotide-binding universal stress UspA family protein